jgi:nicotinamidase-related amidase
MSQGPPPVDPVTRAAAGAAPLSAIERPALLLVDLENDILRGELAPPDAERTFAPVIANCRRLLDAARARGIPVLYSRIAFRPGYPDANPHSPARQRGNLLLVDTWGAEIVDELAPLPSEIVITKKRTSAFFRTELDLVLHALGVRSVILAGTATNRAVESTARDAHSYDYEVYVVADACAAVKPDLHEPSLRSMADFFGGVYTTDAILAAIRG